MTHVKALQAGHSSQGTSEPITPVPPCALVCLTLFGNVYVHVQKRAGDTYHGNEMDKYNRYFQCQMAKLILINPCKIM